MEICADTQNINKDKALKAHRNSSQGQRPWNVCYTKPFRAESASQTAISMLM